MPSAEHPAERPASCSPIPSRPGASNARSSSPVPTSHTCIRTFSPPVINPLPSGERTTSLCHPFHVRTAFLLSSSRRVHSRTLSSRVAVNSLFPSGVYARCLGSPVSFRVANFLPVAVS